MTRDAICNCCHEGQPCPCCQVHGDLAYSPVEPRLIQHTMPPKGDNINHPEHYQTKGGLEAIQVIEEFNLGFNLGNAVKYILRAGKKQDRHEDLEKARWYLTRELTNGDRPVDAGLDSEKP